MIADLIVQVQKSEWRKFAVSQKTRHEKQPVQGHPTYRKKSKYMPVRLSAIASPCLMEVG